MYAIEVIDLESTWLRQRDQFDALAGNYYTRRFAWMSSWWDAYRTSDTNLHILKVADGSKVIAYLPLYLDASTKQLQLLGSGKACSDDLGVYVLTGHETLAVSALVKHLYESGFQGQWDSLRLEGVRNDCPVMNCLLLEMRTAFGSDFSEYVDQPCRVINLPGSFEDYFSKVVAHTQRSKLRRDVRNFLDTGKCTYEIANTLESAREHLAVVSKLHQVRWESKGEAGCTADLRFQQCMSFSCERLFAEGTWFSILLSHERKVVAGAIGAQSPMYVCNYMSGMDPNITEFRPGILMNLAIIRYACQQGCKYYDLMRGDEPYKSRMGATAVPQYNWIASAPRLIPRLFGRVESSKQTLKHWLKQYRAAAQSGG